MSAGTFAASAWSTDELVVGVVLLGVELPHAATVAAISTAAPASPSGRRTRADRHAYRDEFIHLPISGFYM